MKMEQFRGIDTPSVRSICVQGTWITTGEQGIAIDADHDTIIAGHGQLHIDIAAVSAVHYGDPCILGPLV